MLMKSSSTIIGLSFLLLIQTHSAYGNDRICLTKHMSSATSGSAFYVTKAKLVASPKWNPGENLPLSLGDAIAIAKKWAQEKPDMSNCDLLGVKLSRISIGEDTGYRWFYDISFVDASNPTQRAALYSIVILLDGSIVESDDL